MRRTGTLLLARDEDEVAELERALAFRRSLGLNVERLRPSQAREREPALAPTLRLALELPDDHCRRPAPGDRGPALACEAAGVRLREHTGVSSLLLDAGRVQGWRLADGERVMSDAVVLAMGPWAEQIEGLAEEARVPVRPVKGQILRLRDPAGPGLLDRVVRYEGGYLVPRGDGRYVLGATVEERGFELAPTAGGVYELLREARELVPGVTELEIEELSVGLRPGTPTTCRRSAGAPSRAWSGPPGHHRNGILLAPLTARAGERPARRRELGRTELLAACDPARFLHGSECLRFDVRGR